MFESLFEKIADDLHLHGYSVNPAALPAGLCKALLAEILNNLLQNFQPARIGRTSAHKLDAQIRQDRTLWIEGTTAAQKEWLDFSAALQHALNRKLFLGLFSFESHCAHYQPGAFYKRHLDAFKGQSNRVLSVVAYLNPDWQTHWGGELVIYPQNDANTPILHVTPEMGTFVVFLSEEFPHEVLPANKDRYSIAGWFGVNNQ